MTVTLVALLRLMYALSLCNYGAEFKQ